MIADERDEIGSRTVLRLNDRVFMYPVIADRKHVPQLFLDITERVQTLAINPEFYHSLLNNCTNNIVVHTYKLTPEPIDCGTGLCRPIRALEEDHWQRFQQLLGIAGILPH